MPNSFERRRCAPIVLRGSVGWRSLVDIRHITPQTTVVPDSVETKPSDQYHHGNLRHALVICAMTLLEDEGESAVTLRTVAKRVGVSHNAPYRHFDSKGALMRAVATEGHRALERALRDAAEGESRWRVPELIGVTRAYVRFMFDHEALATLMFESPHEASDADLSSAQGASFGVLHDAVARTEAYAEEDTREVAFLLWAAAFGTIRLVPRDGKMEREERERWVLERLARLLAIVFPYLREDARRLPPS